MLKRAIIITVLIGTITSGYNQDKVYALEDSYKLDAINYNDQNGIYASYIPPEEIHQSINNEKVLYVNMKSDVKMMNEIVQTYLGNKKLSYGNDYTAVSKSDRAILTKSNQYNIDCSSFVQLVLGGITFENSAYSRKDRTNIYDKEGLRFTPKHALFYDDRVLSHDLARYAYKQGWTFTGGNNLRHVKPGDLFFTKQKNMRFFNGVGHVGIVKSVNYQNGTFTSYDGASGYNPAVIEYKRKLEEGMFFARYPLYNEQLYNNINKVNAKEKEYKIKILN